MSSRPSEKKASLGGLDKKVNLSILSIYSSYTRLSLRSEGI
ncbi:hypothetical protein LCGC14_0769990 [marine sediment metagenome]|uniref:Uncharacterized protein n=1 Tax=marine sediment metagenome TaxID=412755 RepID=A0A0F9Q2U8_9ZZZZ